jgi:hypothetical protein
VLQDLGEKGDVVTVVDDWVRDLLKIPSDIFNACAFEQRPEVARFARAPVVLCRTEIDRSSLVTGSGKRGYLVAWGRAKLDDLCRRRKVSENEVADIFESLLPGDAEISRPVHEMTA